MPDNKFILERKVTYKQTDKYPKIHIGQKTYGILASMAAETGLPMAEIARRAVAYAKSNLVYIDQLKAE